MKLAVGSDHRGFEGKKRLIPQLKRWGHEVHDFGCETTAACDYPDIASAVAKSVAAGAYEAGILLDGSGIGMSIAANKVPGIRAALVHDDVTARLAREANHANVLCIGTDLLSEEHVRRIVEIFLNTAFVDGRHLRRVNKVRKLELEAMEHAGQHNAACAPTAGTAAHAAAHAPAGAGKVAVAVR